MDYILKKKSITIRTFSNKDEEYVNNWVARFYKGDANDLDIIPLYEVPLPKASGRCYPNLRLSPLKASVAMT